MNTKEPLPKKERLPAVPTPELDKLHAVTDKSQSIGEFVAWLETKGITLCYDDGQHYEPDYTSIEKRLAEFFKIDLAKCEKERMAVLNHFRKAGA